MFACLALAMEVRAPSLGQDAAENPGSNKCLVF